MGDKVGIHVLVWGQYGVLEWVTIHSWLWNVTLGDATSYDNLITVEKSSTNPYFKSVNL